ncbi:MAG: thymidylate kinase [Clostridia bacterium]|nr:thymidylate kinase [Clostridia bacterium]
MGKLIVIEGLDGSGKSTQAPILAEALRSMGKEVREISFPVYGSDSSALVRMYLGGEFGSRPGDVNAYAASSFYAVDRFASYKKDWKAFYEKEDCVLIATRYTSANEIHQLAKLERSEWDDFLRWAEDFEYRKMGIPRPDAVLYLDMRYDIALSLVGGRSEATGQKKDIHELDTDYMSRCHEAAAYASEKLGWKTIVCYRDNAPLPMNEISAEILKEAKTLLGISR